MLGCTASLDISSSERADIRLIAKLCHIRGRKEKDTEQNWEKEVIINTKGQDSSSSSLHSTPLLIQSALYDII